MRQSLIPLFLCMLLNSCLLVGPNYKEPVKKAAAHWIKTNASVRETPIKKVTWWQVFNDPTLTALINQGYHNNLSLQSTGVHVLQARAQLAQAVGELFPQQQAASGNITYQRLGGSSLQTVLPNNFDTVLLGLSASWEIDFWGKYRRAILANDAVFLSSYAAYDNALVSLTADIATAYINIRTTQKLISITKQNIQVQRLGLDIAKARFNAGQVSLLDVEQATAELYQTEATLPDYLSTLQTQKDLLGVLLGTTPDCVDGLLKKNRGIPKSPLHVAVGIPRETLASRPDIFEARMQAIAQSETIGAIKANLYPSFSLTGSFAFASNTIGTQSLGDLFHWSNRNVVGTAGFTWPILNYGQITNAVRAQDALFQQSVLKYLNLVLKAQQEVQDKITQFIEAQKAERYLRVATNAAIRATKLSLIRYKEGEVDYTPVLDALRQQLRVETNLINNQGKIPKALVGLYRALGGGWQIRKCNDIVADQIKREMGARTDWGSLLKQTNHQPPQSKSQQLKELYLPNW